MMEKFTPISGSRFWREFHATGCIHADMGETVASQLDDPRTWIEHTLGGTTNAPQNYRDPLTVGDQILKIARVIVIQTNHDGFNGSSRHTYLNTTTSF
jgi:hypothetical protein